MNYAEIIQANDIFITDERKMVRLLRSWHKDKSNGRLHSNKTLKSDQEGPPLKPIREQEARRATDLAKHN